MLVEYQIRAITVVVMQVVVVVVPVEQDKMDPVLIPITLVDMVV
jgi:hypothetical protein